MRAEMVHYFEVPNNYVAGFSFFAYPDKLPFLL